jgi:CelD/BcsL family acetyltransferase involved in cellulose biosynthesis
MAAGSLLTLPAGQNGSQATEVRNPSAALRDLDGLSLRVVTRLADLSDEFEAWDDLARTAGTPNPFYESWFLADACRWFAPKAQFRLVLVEERDQKRGSTRLVGVVPLESRRKFGHWPVPHLRTIEHPYAFLGAPLLRAGYEPAVWRLILGSLSTIDPRAKLLDLHTIPMDSPAAIALGDELRESDRAWSQLELYHRAFLNRAPSAETYFLSAMTSHQRQELRRRSRRLSESGEIRHETVETVAQLEDWITGFLTLEARGWKGTADGAMAHDSSRGDFLLNTVTAAFLRGQADLSTLLLDGRPIAMKCNFRAARGAFAFKIAFDEELSRFSPGVLMELENVRRVHESSQTDWMDSCAIPGHFMINRLWSERRPIARLLISSGSRTGDLAVGALPLVSTVKRCLRPKGAQS